MNWFVHYRIAEHVRLVDTRIDLCRRDRQCCKCDTDRTHCQEPKYLDHGIILLVFVRRGNGRFDFAAGEVQKIRNRGAYMSICREVRSDLRDYLCLGSEPRTKSSRIRRREMKIRSYAVEWLSRVYAHTARCQ